METYQSELRRIAPHIVFSVSRRRDDFFRWDGDGPDPREDGYDAYDVEVKAETVLDGERIEASAYLGGTYYKTDEPIGDIGGYLPQMLEEAARELAKLLPDTALCFEAFVASQYMIRVLRERYDAAQKKPTTTV